MKNNPFQCKSIKACLFVLSIFLLSSCRNWTLPPELVGDWETERIMVTVRSKLAKKQWVFTSDSVSISITIHSDHRVTGTIGTATFENGKIRKNPGNPEKRGLSEIIECGSIGKIFENDPLDAKEVQLWLPPIEDNSIDAELRFTEGMAHFPMAGMLLKKVGD